MRGWEPGWDKGSPEKLEPAPTLLPRPLSILPSPAPRVLPDFVHVHLQLLVTFLEPLVLRDLLMPHLLWEGVSGPAQPSTLPPTVTS